ncbi:MAG: MFS transporter, partial [Dehalococcoidia bacterium]|nr:MFS transporter [Dehalococcoidia bacterium]
MSGAQPRKPGWIPYITADGWLLIATCGMRAFAYGFLSVMLGLYLSSQGLQAEAIGAIFTVAMAGGAATTLGLTTIADRIGRRRVLIIGAVMMVLAGVVFAVSDNLVFLFIAAGLGTINPAGGDVGPFLSIEQAILSQATTDEHRTSVFAHYNIVKSMAGALGALAVGLPTILGLAPMPGYHALLWGYVASAFILLALFFRLTPAVEAPAIATGPWHKLGLHKSHKVVAKLAALFAL